jgi:hypothetical protein
MNKFLKFPLIFIIGIIGGLLVSNLFIFSDKLEDYEITKEDTIDTSISPYEIFQPPIPTELTFCGEQVPLNYFDVYEALDFELIVNTYRHSLTTTYLKRANRYFPEIEKMLAEHGIPDDIKYLCVAESGLANVISSSGATGFWQFMKPAAEEYNLTVNKNIDERYNRKKSLIAAAKYLKKSYDKFGTWSLAAASYNMGSSGLQKVIDKQKINSYWDLDLSSETARYVYRILALKVIMNNPELYGFNIPKENLYNKIDTYEITIDTAINDLVQFAFDNGTNYKILKYFNTWLRSTELPNPSKKKYTIILPKKRER